MYIYVHKCQTHNVNVRRKWNKDVAIKLFRVKLVAGYIQKPHKRWQQITIKTTQKDITDAIALTQSDYGEASNIGLFELF